VSALTVLILIPNAGDRLPRCLESVQWADDIFCIVDPKTNDGSDDVARRYSKHVVTHEYVNKANQCTWAIAQIETEWTLVLDADEWIADPLRDRILAIIKDPGSKDGYDIRRLSIFFGKEIARCGWDRDYNVRLFRTKKGQYLDRRVHSKIVIDGPMGRIEEPMYHDTYRTFEEYFATFQRFTTWGAQDLFDAGRRAKLSDLTLRPIIRFLKMYVVKQGFRDGLHGAVLCGLAACSVFTKYAKLWNLGRLEREKAAK
jgi:glycosyltransferase involved in cell wall biosynthesis